MSGRKLKHEGLVIGDRIRAYDFQPCEGRDPLYIEGEIVDTRTPEQMQADGREPYACYVVQVDRDTMMPPGARTTVLVPFETTFDYDERVTKLAREHRCGNCHAEFDAVDALFTFNGDGRCPDCASSEVEPALRRTAAPLLRAHARAMRDEYDARYLERRAAELEG